MGGSRRHPDTTNDGGNGAAAKTYDIKTHLIGGSRSPHCSSIQQNEPFKPTSSSIFP